MSHAAHLEPVSASEPPELHDDEAAPPGKAPSGRALRTAIEELNERLGTAQALLAASGKQALLVVLQGRDTAGKDGTIRNVFSACNPQGCRVTSFAAPSGAELARDYLWRVHRAVPPRGMIGIFNRSHYEDVLAARVRGLVPEAAWSRRFRHIAEFERMLVDEGTLVLKFFLHVSKEEQRERLQARLDDPTKHWKFAVGDLDERKRWDEYQAAYSAMIAATGTAWAPWTVVPADSKTHRNLMIATAVAGSLRKLKLRYPAGDPALANITVP